MAKRLPKDDSNPVDEAIRQIEKYHEMGRAILGLEPARGGFDRAEILELAKGLKWNETKARKARQFARLYTREQLAELFRLVRKHKPHFGTSHVGILVTVPDARKRAILLRWCIEGRRSKAELELEVKKRLGSRQRKGGRRRRVAADPALALLQLDEMVDTWLRWYDVAIEGPRGNGRRKAVLDRLPVAVREQALVVDLAVENLQVVIDGELGRAASGRRRTGGR